METYVIKSPLPMMFSSVGDHQYKIPAVRDLPSEERPREKLLTLGPSALTPQELLAVVFEKGTRKEGVLEMTERVMRDYGEKNILSATEVVRLAEELSLPVSKALQVVAVGELGRRFFRRERDGGSVLRNAKDTYEYCVDMRNLKKETLRGIYLNAHYQVIHDEVISVGTVDASIIHPREVFRPAISHGAAAVILVHNHPSGVLAASNADREMTSQVQESGKILGIEVVDHLIVTEGGFISILHN